ncbi:hypothetical protein GCM10027064_01300 [Microbacterium petrolearium]|jgi:hypothetical protein
MTSEFDTETIDTTTALRMPAMYGLFVESVSALLLEAEPGWIVALALMALGIAIAIGGLVLALRRSGRARAAE